MSESLSQAIDRAATELAEASRLASEAHGRYEAAAAERHDFEDRAREAREEFDRAVQALIEAKINQ
jgi:hypothetical protein